MPNLIIALDKSARSYDADGRLHVAVSHISKATVNPYRGDEIPDGAGLGLDPNKVYMLLRDPNELGKGADSFNNLPLLSRHVPVSASDPQKEVVVGSTGTDAVFKAPYLDNSLVVWDAEAIAAIEAKDLAQISCGYRYTPDMTPGVYEGMSYDGIMRGIVGNHVALVEAGRAGPDVVVADANPFSTSSEVIDMGKVSKRYSIALAKRLKAAGLAVDEDVLAKAAEEAAKDESEEEARRNEARGGEKANRELDKEHPHREGEGKGAGPDPEDGYIIDRIVKVLSAAGIPAAVIDAVREVGKKPNEDEDREEARANEIHGGEEANRKLEEERKGAMDAAIKLSESRALARFNAIRRAEREVAPIVGEVAAMDSAEAVYKMALDHLGIDCSGVAASGYGALLRAVTANTKTPATIAQDSANATGDFWGQFKKIDAAKLPGRV